MQVDLETQVKVYLPIIFEILDKDSISAKKWKKINDKHQAEYQKRKKQWEDNTRKTFEINLYDLFEMYREGNRGAYKFLDMIKRTLEELHSSLPEKDRTKIKGTIYSMLVELDKTHRNYIGELLVLNNAIKHQQYKLISIESPITKSTKADFLLKNLITGDTELVEIVNLHIDDDKENLGLFITGKLEEKFGMKTKGISDHYKFTLVPVIWGSYALLRRIEAVYNNGEIPNLPYCLPACAFITYDYVGTNEFTVHFGTITTLFKGLNIQEP